MADDFQRGLCGWWADAAASSTGFDAPAIATSASCSAASSSVTFDQDTHIVGAPLIDRPSQNHGFGLAQSTMDWSQALLKSSERVHESSMQPYFVNGEPAIDANRTQTEVGDHSSMNPFEGMSHRPSSGDVRNFQLAPVVGNYGFFEPDSYYGSSGELPKYPHLIESSSTREPPESSVNHLRFSNHTQFWNASSESSFTGFIPPSQFATSNVDGARGSSSSTVKKSGGGSEKAMKKPRLEMPSPLPTFKVRKEKLGDRITALQQLVSPFGKTDTASVLHDTIEYIRFLHDQVAVLSNPYLKNGHPMHNHHHHHQQQKQKQESSKDGAREGQNRDLGSRGLCLVPVASTYAVASDNPLDFWNPTFGGTIFR